MKKKELEINIIFKLGVYLQMMSSFCKEINVTEVNHLNREFKVLIENNNPKEIETKIPIFKQKFELLATATILKYKPKQDFHNLVKNWNNLVTENKEIFERGVMYGWLQKQVDLTNYLSYDYAPYHFKIGLNFNKGKGDIEENFLLKDSFLCLSKAKLNFDLLKKYNNTWDEKFENIEMNSQKRNFISELNLIKQEVAFYCRMSIISFFSFLESFINSIGYDYYYRNEEKLSIKEIEILKGYKNGNYLNTKKKSKNFRVLLGVIKKLN